MWTFTRISREVFHVKSHEKFMWSSLHTNFTWILCEFQMKLVKFTWSFIHVNLTWGTIGCVGREYNFYIWTCRHVLYILDLGVRERASPSIKSNNVYLNTFKRNIKRINTFCTRVVHVLWRRQGMLYDVYEFVRCYNQKLFAEIIFLSRVSSWFQRKNFNLSWYQVRKINFFFQTILLCRLVY